MANWLIHLLFARGTNVALLGHWSIYLFEKTAFPRVKFKSKYVLYLVK
jgi:hypothetical protein